MLDGYDPGGQVLLRLVPVGKPRRIESSPEQADPDYQTSFFRWVAQSYALNTVRMVIAVATVIVVAEHRFRTNQGYGYLIAWLYVGCLFTLWAVQDSSIWKYTRGRPWRIYQHSVAFCVLALWCISFVFGFHTTTIGIAGFLVAFAAIAIELVAILILWKRDRGQVFVHTTQPAR